jgi:ABC-type glutathione transport system ATPase component
VLWGILLNIVNLLTALLCPNNQLMIVVYGSSDLNSILSIASIAGSCLFSVLIITCFEYSHLFNTRDIRSSDCSTVSMSDVSKRAVKNLDMKFEKNEIFCLLGVNGAGKSTTIKMLVSQLNPESGTVSVFGKIPQKDKFAALKKLTYCSQKDHMLVKRQSVQNHLKFFISLSTKVKARQEEIFQAFVKHSSFKTLSKL